MGKHRQRRGWKRDASDDVRTGQALADAWTHPADALDAEEGPAPAAVDPASAAILRALVELIVPPATYGRVRRFEAGYHRLVVLVYRIAPEYFPGWTREDLARALGITKRPLAEHFAAVERALARRSAQREASPDL